jgi:hypothetical protein
MEGLAQREDELDCIDVVRPGSSAHPRTITRPGAEPENTNARAATQAFVRIKTN